LKDWGKPRKSQDTLRPSRDSNRAPPCGYRGLINLLLFLNKGKLETKHEKHIVTCKGLAWLIIMGSGFDDWVYWHLFIITVDYNSSYIELLLNDVCLVNLSLISDWSLLQPFITARRPE
jgi:hypothetical protein